MKTEKKLEYWSCDIGPIDRSEVSFGGDGPLRASVQSKFIEMFDKRAEICSSGWGLTQEMKRRLDIISFLPTTDPSGKILEQIDEILSKRQMN